MWRSGTAERCNREASTRAAVYVDSVMRKVGEIVEPIDTLQRVIMSKNEVFTRRDGGLTLIGVEAMVCRMLQMLQLEVLAATVHEWVEGKQGDQGASVSRESFDDLRDKWQASISQPDAVEGGTIPAEVNTVANIKLIPKLKLQILRIKIIPKTINPHEITDVTVVG